TASAVFGSAVSAEVARTFPDGRIMDDLPSGGSSSPGNGSPGMVLSQVYSNGGQSGSQFRQDFVELLNRGTTSVSLSGWSVQYANAGSGSWQVAALSGTVAPGQYYLLRCWSGPSGNGDIPTADATCSINLGDTAGKVALVNSTTPLVGAVPSGS